MNPPDYQSGSPYNYIPNSNTGAYVSPQLTTQRHRYSHPQPQGYIPPQAYPPQVPYAASHAHPQPYNNYSQAPAPLQPGAPTVVSRTFRSLEDFVREQDQLDSTRSQHMKQAAANALAQGPQRRPRKKAPSAVDQEAIAAEARAVAEIGDTNWTGRLGEYRAAHPTAATIKGIEYNELNGPRFRCTVTIHEAPHMPFGQGDVSLSFTKKKEAKQYASKKAIDWLMQSGFMPPDGTVRWPKSTPLPGAKIIGPKIPTASPVVTGKTSFAAKVPPFAHKLGFSPPTYDISRVSEEAPIYNGFAHWPNDARIEGKVGEVINIYGQKSAKEAIAKLVLEFLADIENQRTASVGEAQADADTEASDKFHSSSPPVLAPASTSYEDVKEESKEDSQAKDSETKTFKTEDVKQDMVEEMNPEILVTIRAAAKQTKEVKEVKEEEGLKRKRSVSQDRETEENAGKALRLELSNPIT
ncbi:hypothetical protein BJ878DRAFT_459455 [Calycina marina]|uniref:DRBM domain-containing protein n=1 Tax=Calycina marina TaxID=1763456 RepID=A0A9P8CFI3_9HELO|nr:hypothetical protein BJ878DRAFT_459455 [Calycina marina]